MFADPFDIHFLNFLKNLMPILSVLCPEVSLLGWLENLQQRSKCHHSPVAALSSLCNLHASAA
jgi:hypothetical protein